MHGKRHFNAANVQAHGWLGGARYAMALCPQYGTSLLTVCFNAASCMSGLQAARARLGLGGWGRLVLWMEAWVDDAVHVKVEVVELDAVWVGLRNVHRDLHITQNLCILFNAINYNFWVPACQAWHVLFVELAPRSTHTLLGSGTFAGGGVHVIAYRPCSALELMCHAGQRDATGE